METTYLDLGKGQVERKTAGWSDKQIFGKTVEQLDTMLKGQEMVLKTLRQNVQDQEDRVHDMKRIIRRRQELVEEGYKG